VKARARERKRGACKNRRTGWVGRRKMGWDSCYCTLLFLTAQKEASGEENE
jgi:hypothetical protein